MKIDDLDGSSIVENPERDPNGTDLVRLDDVERAHILKILEQCNWRIHGEKGAAELLDINPSTLRSRMKKLDIRNKKSVAE